LKTTQIYAHYAPSEHEVQVVDDAFGTPKTPAARRRRKKRQA